MRLSASGVVVRFGERTVLDGAALSVESGVVAIVGPSGSGKSTLLSVIGGLLRPAVGTVEIDGLDGEPHFGWIFQTSPLLSHRTAVDNVALGAMVVGDDRAPAHASALGALRTVGLEDLADRRGGLLSGGERQRVVIARLLVNRPDIVLADEPTASLDAANRDLVGAALAALGRTVPVLVATHDEQLARTADRVVRLVDGRCLEER